MRRAAAAALVLLALGAWGSFERVDRSLQTEARRLGPSALATADSGVRGLVLIGPTCPVERTPPDPACADRPYDARLRFLRGGRAVAVVRSGADGRFRIALAPGRYTIVPEARTAASLPYARPLEVTVRAHAFTRVRIEFDSGIR